MNWAEFDKNIYQSSSNMPVIFFDFNETWHFWKDFLQILEYQMSLKSIHWEQSCLCGRTDKTNVIVNFRNFVNVLEIDENIIFKIVLFTQEFFEI